MIRTTTRCSWAWGVCLLAAAAGAQAQITTGYGAVADAGFYDSCATICLRPGGLDNQVVDGGEFSTEASASLVNSLVERSFGSATFTGDVFSPLLRSSSRSPTADDNATDAIVTAIQGYTYMGAAAQDYAVQVSLTGTITERDGRAEGSIEGRVAVYTYENATFSTNYSSFILEEVASEGEVLDRGQLFLLTTLDLSEATLNFTLNPGDEIYVFMQLETKSERGAVVDATNTLSLSFTSGDVSMLNAVIQPLPDVVYANGFETVD